MIEDITTLRLQRDTLHQVLKDLINKIEAMSGCNEADYHPSSDEVWPEFEAARHAIFNFTPPI